MSDALKQYNALLTQIKQANGYKPGMGAAGVALLARCRAEASAKHAAMQGKPAPKPALGAKYRPTFASSDKSIRPCAKLSADSCQTSPQCTWQPKANRCITKSGKNAVTLFDNPKRNAMLDSIRAIRRQQQQQQQQGGYWF
jgi:hypothetical protein